MEFNYIAHDNQSKSKSMKKNSDQESCPWLAPTGKEQWIKLTGPVTFIHIYKYSKTEILGFCY